MLAQSANFAVKTYFSESLGISDGYSGGIYCIQSHGTFYNFHPHLHSLVLPGLVKDGTFHQQKNISPAVIARLFRARLLDMLKTEGVIRQEVVDLLLSWNHNSGFNVHIGDPIDGSDEKTIENVARYMNRSPISVERVQYDPDSGTVIVHEKSRSASTEAAKPTRLMNSWLWWPPISPCRMKCAPFIMEFIHPATVGLKIKSKNKGLRLF